MTGKDEERMKDNERILDYFFEKRKAVHIGCKDLRFYNGKILEINFDKRWVIFIDNVLGEIPILFEEIRNIEPFREEVV